MVLFAQRAKRAPPSGARRDQAERAKRAHRGVLIIFVFLHIVLIIFVFVHIVAAAGRSCAVLELPAQVVRGTMSA